MIPGTFLLGVVDTLIKRILKDKEFNQQLLLSIDFIGSGLLLAVPLFIFGLPETRPGFWSAFIVSTSLNIFAQWAWFTAFKKEEASLIAPLRLLTPPLVIVTGYFVLAEKPSLVGTVGIFITIIGLWFLLDVEAKKDHVHFWQTFKRPGVLLGLWGAVSFAISFPFDKKAVLTSSPLLLASTSLFIVGLANLLIGYFKDTKKDFFIGLKKDLKLALVIPFVHAAASLMTNSALLFAFAAYAASVKRLWSLWTILLSGKFLQETNISKKLLSTMVMFLGIAITVFLG